MIYNTERPQHKWNALKHDIINVRQHYYYLVTYTVHLNELSSHSITATITEQCSRIATNDECTTSRELMTVTICGKLKVQNCLYTAHAHSHARAYSKYYLHIGSPFAWISSTSISTYDYTDNTDLANTKWTRYDGINHY